jgi:ribosomal-protein-alanine N-acetyltransferase
MYYINSNRLRLVPLSFDQLVLLIESRNELEMELGLQLSDFKLNTDDSFLAAFSQVIRDQVLPLMKEHADQMEWYTHWMIVEKEHNITVGGMGMNGPPDKDGQVMIGYFTDKKFEGRGYATEALKAFVEWIFHDPSAGSVIADTLAEGYASQKVLAKNGFLFEQETEEGLRWKLSR